MSKPSFVVRAIHSHRVRTSARFLFVGALGALGAFGSLGACSDGTLEDGTVDDSRADALRAPSITSDEANLYVTIPYRGTPTFVALFLDTDHTPSTGFAIGGVGAGFLLENGTLYRYSGSGGDDWAWSPIGAVPTSQIDGGARFTIARADLGSPSVLDVVSRIRWGNKARTSSKVTYSLQGTTPAPGPTTSPTTSPATSPTTAPTTSPTTSPTTAPTTAPTSPPTTDPTTPPTTDPTTPPTTDPTTPPTSPPSTQPFTAPALVNPVSPMQFGAKCDGVTNDAAAFQAAVNAGDVLVPAGTCVINTTVEITMSNRHIECSAGAVIKQTDGMAGRVFNILSQSGGRLTGDSIVNCEFVGANTEAPQYYNDDSRHYNIPVQTQDRVDNFLLAGNTFRQFFGQSMFQTYGGVDGGTGDQIIYNTFKSCGYYGPVFAAHANGYIGHNTLVDCALGVENDDATQLSGGNIIEYNTLTAVHGYGAPDMGTSVMLTGGAATNANYSTNIVRNNTVSGVSDADGFQGAGKPSEIYEPAPGGAAQYNNNVCGTGCRIIQ